MKSADSLDQIKVIIKRLSLNLAHDAIYSELAFGHILTTNCSLASDFLLDPFLNSPAATNYSRIVIYLKENAVGEAEQKTLLQAVFRGFSVGLVRREEAQLILQHLLDIIVNSEGGPVPARETLRINVYYSAILKRLRECDVFGLKDLGADIINAWIGYIRQLPYSRYSAKLILSISKSVALSQAMERFHPGSGPLIDFMFHAEINAMSDLIEGWLEYACQRPAQREDHLRNLAQFLSTLSPAVLTSTVVGIPERLVVSIQNQMLSPGILRLWEQILRSFEKETVAPILRERCIWTERINETAAGLPADGRLLLRVWTALNLCNKAEKSSPVFEQMNFPSQLREQFKEWDPALLWNRILLTLQSLPKLHFRGGLSDFLNNVNQRYSAEDIVRTAKHQATLDAFTSQGFAILRDDKTYFHALEYMNDPLKELAESVNKDIACFARIVLPLIARDRLSLPIVTRVLKHNQSFHFALHSAWSPSAGKGRNVAKFSDPPNSLGRLTDFAAHPKTTGKTGFNEEVVNFMNDLAISFALSLAMSDREALRRSFWCYSFLHRYGAPIGPPITKALWYAGVTRCEGAGTSRRVIVWLLRKIREVEGPVTAEGLITSREFRSKRAREVWNWGRSLGAGLVRDEERAVTENDSLILEEGNSVEGDQASTQDKEVHLKIRKSTDIAVRKLAKDISLSKHRHTKGSACRTETESRLRESAPKGPRAKRPVKDSAVSATPTPAEAAGATTPHQPKQVLAKPLDLSRPLAGGPMRVLRVSARAEREEGFGRVKWLTD